MEAVYGDQAEYLCVGDTVLIKFSHKIFQNDVDQYEEIKNLGDLQDENIQNLTPIQKEAKDDQVRKMKLAKLITDPVYNFKGMVYCDGIIDS